MGDSGLSSDRQLIPEQNKEHISRKLVFGIQFQNENYKVTVSSPLEGTRHLTILIMKIAIATIFIVLLLVILINRQLLSRIWEPFYKSLELIKTFKVSKPVSLKFPQTRIDEFRLMNTHFSTAAQNAARDYRNLKEFSENASHEIQTPLAIIHSKLDLMAQQENLTEKQSELLHSVYASVGKLSNLQQSLSLLTRIDNKQFLPEEIIDLHEAVKNKILQFQELWQNRGIDMLAETEPARLPANRELTDILLNNLFSNAIRHNISNGRMKIILKQGLLEFGNTGIPQPLDNDRIFKRFYKGVSNTASNGLGLSIIREICDSSDITLSYTYKANWHFFRLTW